MTHRLHILALDDEPEMIALYREAFSDQHSVSVQEDAFDLEICSRRNNSIETVKGAKKRGNPFELVILNLEFVSGLKSIQIAKEISLFDSYLNFILVIKSEKDLMPDLVRSLSSEDKFIFIQQPVHIYELRQFASVLGAKFKNDTLLKKTRGELEIKISELENKSQELLVKKEELENLNTQLMETNNALTVLARNLENTRKESERRMFQKTRTLILPVLDKITQGRGMKKYRNDLDLLSGYILNLTSDFSADVRLFASLSITEARIASMIKNGMSSDEIARHLNISHYTVKTHRKNIRKKLNLLNSGVNLRAYLESKMELR